MMKSVVFPEMNTELAKGQPEYETLNVFTEYRDIANPLFGHMPDAPETVNVPWSMTACFELSDEEIEEIIRTRRFWHTQMLFGHNFQPIRMSTQNPFASGATSNDTTNTEA